MCLRSRTDDLKVAFGMDARPSVEDQFGVMR
jgi:hypothetical protein